MWLFKGLGLLLIFTVSCSIGFIKSANIKKRAQKLWSLACSTYNLAQRIRGDGGEIAGLISSAFDRQAVTVNGGRIELSEDNLCSDDISLLNEFFSKLGMSDKTAEYERTNAYARLIEERYAFAKAECNKLCKLYSTLGVLCGIGLCIFFL